uniref:TAFII55 protein conserved region domain-containing protein n=1 Tax=Oryza punctata TaxID=4537 RepID=A0A0E0L180_ORYPU
MEEQFILRVPPSVAERIERLMNESAAASSSSNPEDASLDLSFSDQNASAILRAGEGGDRKKAGPAPATKPNVKQPAANGVEAEAERSDSDESVDP